MSVQISTKDAYAYAELLEILSFIDINLVNKIPKQLITIFQENASSVYTKHLNKSIPLEEQDISFETASLITLISLNYWCKSEDEKNNLKSVLLENEEIKNKKLAEKYNPNNIFNKNNIYSPNCSQTNTQTENTSNNLPIDISQMPWYSKILLKIRKIISKLIKNN